MIEIQPVSTREIERAQVRGECPDCGVKTHFTAHSSSNISGLREIVRPNTPTRCTSVWICDSCRSFIYVEWNIFDPNPSSPQFNNPTVINPEYIRIDTTGAPKEVQEDLDEAVKCLSVGCTNAFAAMCRRTIQSICTDKGATGSTKVQNQVKEFCEISGLADDSEDAKCLDLLTKNGTDGAHPHLPAVDGSRAKLMLKLLSDLVDQIYNRPARIQSLAASRAQAIDTRKNQ